jgi:hypothetical protein
MRNTSCMATMHAQGSTPGTVSASPGAARTSDDEKKDRGLRHVPCRRLPLHSVLTGQLVTNKTGVPAKGQQAVACITFGGVNYQHAAPANHPIINTLLCHFKWPTCAKQSGLQVSHYRDCRNAIHQQQQWQCCYSPCAPLSITSPPTNCPMLLTGSGRLKLPACRTKSALDLHKESNT